MFAQIRSLVVAIAALALAAPVMAQAPSFGKNSKSFVKMHEDAKPYTPIPLSEAAKTSPLTQADSEEKFVEIEKRWIVDSYLKHGDPRDPKLDDRVVAYLNKAAKWYVGVGGAPVSKELGQEGLKLLEDGCRDPLVTWIAFFLARESGVFEPKLEDMGTILDLLTTTKHTPARIALFARWLMRRYAEAGVAPSANRAFNTFTEQLAKAVANPDMDPMEQRYLAEKFDTIMGDLESDPAKLREVATVVLETKGSPQWLRLMFGGRFHVTTAWIARGHGWSSTVSPAGWKDFGEHMEIAQKCFEQAHKLCPQHPDAATDMITVAMNGMHAPGQNSRYWFDQACKSQIDDLQAYSHYTQALLPRWHGSIEAMLSFGRECMTVQRPDALSATFALDVFDQVCEEGEEHAVGWRREGALANMCIGVLQTVIDNPKHWSRADIYRTALAGLAVRAGIWNAGRKALDGLGQPLMPEYTAAYRLMPVDIENAILARTEAATRDFVLAADTKIAGGDIRGAAEELAKAREAVASNDKLKRAIDDLCEHVRILGALQGTDWIQLADGAGSAVPAWRCRDGGWILRPRGMQKIGPGRGMQSMEVPVGDRFEFEATILFAPREEDWTSTAEPVASKTPAKASTPAEALMHAMKAPHGGAGLIFGLSWERCDKGEWFGAIVDPASQQVAMGYRNEPGNPTKLDVDLHEPVRMRVVRFDGTVQIQVNGKTAFTGAVPIDREWHMGPYIGLMLTKDNRYPAAGFRDIRVRRLETSPFATKSAGVPTH